MYEDDYPSDLAYESGYDYESAFLDAMEADEREAERAMAEW